MFAHVLAKLLFMFLHCEAKSKRRLIRGLCTAFQVPRRGLHAREGQPGNQVVKRLLVGMCVLVVGKPERANPSAYVILLPPGESER